MRSLLDATSGLPPLKAATMRAPGTWFGDDGSLNAVANPMTWEVSVPTRPRRRSAARADTEKPSVMAISMAKALVMAGASEMW